MRPSSVSVFVALAHCVTLSLAAPANMEATSSLRPRSQVCQNYPNTVAGKFLQRRDSSTTLPSAPLSIRSNNIVWCAPGTTSYIVLHMMESLPRPGVIGLLQESYNSVHDHIMTRGDGLLTGGLFQWVTDGNVLQAWNANNHQTTWGVLGAAVRALLNFMTANNVYFAGSFFIYDGTNEVGGGHIVRAPD